MFRRPLQLHLCWSPRDTDAVRDVALAIYGFLSRSPTDDPVLRPGVGIPTEIGRDLVELDAALAAGTEPSVVARVIVPILARDGYADPAFRAALTRVVARAASSGGTTVLPIVLDERWYPSLSVDGLDQLAAISTGPDPLASAADRAWKLGCDVGIAVGRVRFGPDEPASTPEIFISHAKADLADTANLALQLRDRIAAETRIRPELDENTLQPGRWLRERLRAHSRAGVLLVVRTDSYSESPWCTEELLVAKTQRVPIVTVLCTSVGESRASIYGGNHRTVHWQPGREWEVIGRCIQAWLHHHHFLAFARAALELAGLPTDSLLLSRRPELLDLGSGERGLVVYPDPPMPEAERDVLRASRPDVRVATPNTLYGRVLMDRDTAPPLADVTLAFSLSDESRLPTIENVEVGRGITTTHLRDTLDAIVLSTIHSGARIAYGGPLRRGGFSEKISDLMIAHRRLGLGGRPQLLCYQGSDAGAGDGAVVYEPIEVAAPEGSDAIADVGMRITLWHHAMRRRASRDANARVLLGGKSRPRAVDGPAGYRAPWPGVLEEAFRTVQAGRALYVIGGFGECAGDIARMLERATVGEALTHATYVGHPEFERLVEDSERARTSVAADPDLVLVGAKGPLRMDDLAQAVLDKWNAFVAGDTASWPNGLSEAENRTLFASTDITEITHLVFAGLARVRERDRSEQALALRCYYGDIASITGVDAYAVTISPGMEPVGASAALDARCGGRLRRVVPARGVEVIAVGSNALAGRHVVVATLDLPAAASPLDPAAITRLTARIGDECGRLGISSIACPPFGTTLGIEVATSVRAMLEGFASAGAPARVTFCEIDAVRIAELRAALPPGFEDIREGPLPPLPPKRAVLYLSALAPDGTTAGRIEASLYHDDLGATVPCGPSDPIDLQTWTQLRSRFGEMDEVAAHGRTLLQRLLPVKVQDELRAHTGAALSIVLDEIASGLPWEALGDPTWTPAITVAMSRRMKLSDAEPTPAPAQRRAARRRFLLVSDPTGDLEGARDEAAAIVALLKRRPDVELVQIAGRDATLARVREALASERWDMFHYAGHAFFDPDAREQSGLKLADEALCASDLVDARVPRLIVLGACESARVRGPDDTDQDPRAARWSFAEGVLRRGVRSFIGTFFVVADAAAQQFSTCLYEGLLAGRQLGDAVRDARALLHRDNQPDWANFLLYGDGTLTL
ncbi:MAG TPA: CHAT domain-containing protein [Nannocystaceae bacterium]|nr:CHAT domain-containing protein [Nannocystaceae bacterium]